MVEATEAETGAVVAGLSALAQETRLFAFRRLLRTGERGMPQGELARELRVPPQTLSFHLRQMSSAGIVRARREGTTVYYSIDFDTVRSLARYLTESCCVLEAPGARRAKGRP